MTPLVPIVPLVLAGLVAWHLVARAHEPAKPVGRARRSPSARASARTGRSTKSRKKRNGG